MRTPSHVFAACALGAGLLVPAIPLAAQEGEGPPAEAGAATTLTPSNVRPDAALASVVTGTAVAFDASASTDADGTIATYEWDLDGDGVFETGSGTEPRVQHEYRGGSTLIATVRVTDDAGASDDASTAVAVAAGPDEAGPAAAPETPEQLVPTDQLADPAPATAPKPRAKRKRERPREKAADRARETRGDPRVSTAANRAVTIRDFDFVPATVTVGVGDSVTWLNQGPTVHTATASDGSFDSGDMARGESYSKTFTSAGTFSYICKPHPFMKGKVVVTAAGEGGGGTAGGGSGGSGSAGGGVSGGSGDTAGTAGSGGDSAGAGGSGTLANTGADLVPWSLFGFSLLAFGAALRLRLTD